MLFVGEEMPVLFWGITSAMTVSAIVFVALPLRKRPGKSDPSATVMLALIPTLAFGLYALVGSPPTVAAGSTPAHSITSEVKAKPASTNGKAAASVASLVDGLKARLNDEPNDAGGWLLLAKSYKHIGNTDDALAAYRRASTLGQFDADLDRLSTNAMAADTATETVEQGPALRGRVALSADAAPLVNAGDTVFIFARQTDSDRMPVVALRKPASQLPFEFALTDDHAMIPGRSLADFPELVVTARISSSGMAQDVSNGLEITSKPTSPASMERIALLITGQAQAGSPAGATQDE